MATFTTVIITNGFSWYCLTWAGKYSDHCPKFWKLTKYISVAVCTHAGLTKNFRRKNKCQMLLFCLNSTSLKKYWFFIFRKYWRSNWRLTIYLPHLPLCVAPHIQFRAIIQGVPQAHNIKSRVFRHYLAQFSCFILIKF